MDLILRGPWGFPSFDTLDTQLKGAVFSPFAGYPVPKPILISLLEGENLPWGLEAQENPSAEGTKDICKGKEECLELATMELYRALYFQTNHAGKNLNKWLISFISKI